MSDNTTLNERVARLETRTKGFEIDMRAAISEIRADVRELLARSNQQMGERNMMRMLIGLLGALSGGVAGWLTHFWWNHP